MNTFDENNNFPENGHIPEPEMPPEFVDADLPAPTAEPVTPDLPEAGEGEPATSEAPEAGERPSDATEPEGTANNAVPPYVPYAAPVAPAPKKKNTAIIVFAIILAAVMILGAALLGAYALIGGVSDALSELPTASQPPEYNTELNDRPGGVEEGTAPYVYQQTVDSVVLIQVYSAVDEEAGAEGSGVIYSEDGYIVTNDHVYADVPDPRFIITLADGRQFDADFIAGDARTDLAVLKIDAPDLIPAAFGDSEQCIVGEEILTIGNPGGSTFTFSMTDGIISALDRWVANSSSYSMRFIQIDAAINSGNSGGALVNMYGQVIGIPTWKYTGDNFENVGFCIPSNTVVRICDDLIAYGYVADRARLGITYTEIDTVTARLGGFASTGLLIAEVTEGTPIYDSGAVTGDMITHIDGEKILEATTVLAALEGHAPGDYVTLTLLREDGRTVDVQVELLEDRGSSSFTLEASGDTPGANGGEFDFPEGE